MPTWNVVLTRDLTARSPKGDLARIGLREDGMTPTNDLRQYGPVENNVARYHGSFASEAAARGYVRDQFPHATIETPARALDF